MNEIKILASLDHPNILRFYEFLEDSNNYYIVTEYFLINFFKNKNYNL